MMLRLTLTLALALVASSLGAQSRPPPKPMSERSPMSGVSARAMRVYRAAIVIDTHNDLPSKMIDEGYNADVRHTPKQGHTDLPRLVASGMTAEFMSAFVDARYARAVPDQSFHRAMTYVDTIHAWVGRHPARLLFATTAADVRRAKREGKVAILIGVEGGHAIENSLDNLRELYRHGVRYVTLTWNNGNEWAGSSIGVGGTRTGGLTPFGRQVIAEMNRLGMLVDVSHVSDSTFFDAVAASSVPVIASHSSARALNDHPRNLSDEQLEAIAKRGGVVNVNFYARFLEPRMARSMDSVDGRGPRVLDSLEQTQGLDSAQAVRVGGRLQSMAVARIRPTPLSVLIDHIDHIARVAGVDHVGLGSDFDGANPMPAGMEDVTRLPRIAQGLLDRGYSEDEVGKILGGNMLRVMQQVLDRREAP